jgi:drug/metabolite transporter (DMT)-like permease
VLPLDRRALVAYVLVCTVWGSTYLFIRMGVEELPPLLFAGLRHLSAGLLLGAIVLARGLERPKSWTELAWLASGGLFFFTLGNGGVVWAEQFVPSGVASVYVVTVVLWTVLADAIIPGGTSRITARVVLGLVAGMAGALLLVGASPRELLSADLRGPVVLTLASMAWAVGTVLMKRRRTSASPFTVAALQMLAGGGTLTLAGLAAGEASSFHLTPTGAGVLAYLVVAGSLVGFGAYAYALRHMSAPALGTYAYANPVVAVLLGAVFLAEPITGRTLAAMALMLGAAAIIQFGGRMPRLGAARTATVAAAPDARD